MARFLDELTLRHPRISRGDAHAERITRTGRSSRGRGLVSDPALDVACYTCGCGYVFDAPVSTSVACPHCGTGQAW